MLLYFIKWAERARPAMTKGYNRRASRQKPRRDVISNMKHLKMPPYGLKDSKKMAKKQEKAKTVILSAAKDLLKQALSAWDGRFFAQRAQNDSCVIYRNNAKYSSG